MLAGKVAELTAGQGYRLSAAEVPERLADTLRARASACAVTDGLFEFLFPTQEAANEALDLLRAEGCMIESVLRTRNTLEEVFMRTLDA